MKKVLAVLLSALVVISAIAPFMVSASKANDAYAVIFTASDFQHTDCYDNLTKMMQNAQKDGITETPEAFLFGGDYTSGSEDPAIQVPKVTETVQAVYPGYSEDNLVYVQGNHDSANAVLTPTGFYEYENFVVYVINEDDFRASQGSKSGYDATVKALASNVANELTIMKQNGDNRPVFIVTHVPLHHSSRSDYGDNLYGKYLFDVLNEYGNDLDIIFLFGHNHSSNYDDYIGGAVNYIAKGETIRIPIPDVTQMGANGYTEETLNFTYMNYGYVGYSNNASSGTSTKTLTMGAFELCPTTIEISRYATDGLYTTETIARVTPLTTEPYVRINGNTTGVEGSSGLLYGASDNIEEPTYSWISSNDSIIKVLPAGKNANVIYTGAGSAEVTLTVTDKDGKSYSKSITITVTEDSTYAPEVSFKRGASDINGQKVKMYNVTYGDGFMIDGTFTGFGDNVDNVTTSWVSTNPSVATVENGYVTYVSSGETTITYVVTDGTTTITKSVNLYISRATKPVDRYVLTSTVEAGKSYVIANVNTVGSAMIMAAPQVMKDTQARMSTVSANIETDGSNELSVQVSTDAAVWTAVSASDGYVYLVNEQYGTYLYCNNDTDGSIIDLGLTTDETKNGAKWVVNASGFLVSNDGNRGIQYSSDGNFRGSAESSISKQFIYERTETVPFVTLKMNNENVDGVTEIIYSVSNSTTRTLKGTYANFGEDATVNWISSDNDIATVDQNGIVSFTGEPGIVDITYLITDENGKTDSATVTFDARVTKEPVRVFKYTETIEPGKKYVALSENSVGAAYLMLSTHKSSAYLTREYAVIQPDSADGNVYVEIAKDHLTPVWVAESTGDDGYYYFVSEDDGTYLWAGTTENVVSTDASLSTYDSELYKWTYDGSTLYNQQINETTAKYTGIKMSSSGYFRITKPAESESSKLYLFEETELIPYVHVRSRYTNVENTTLNRTNISPFQTEILMGKTENFPNNDFVTYEWVSSNTSVASIDDAGVVTYTGNSGTTTITVVATSTVPNEDGTYDTATSTVKIKVNPQILDLRSNFVLTENFVSGESYLIVNSNTVGTAYLMTNTPYVDSNEHRLKSSSCNVEQLDSGLTITNTENGNVWKCVESDTEGYYYLINEATNEYLALVADRDYSPYRRVITTETLDEYDHDAYLIARTSKNQIVSKQSSEYVGSSQAEPNVLRMDSGKNYDFRLSWSSTEKLYIYQRLSSEVVKPKTEIRVSTFMGTSDLTNVLQNRYNITENDTEQLLRYTEGYSSITSTKWSVSDESIATIDENGLVTYTGKEGFVTVTLEVKGTDAANESVAYTVKTTLNVSNDDYESPTNDYPQYPHEGSVRINKTASSMAGGYNFQTSGVTEVELSVTGVPLPQAVDVVVVFDHSSSMNSGGRLTSAIEDTREFALQVVNANRNNRIAIVTFDRYKENYKSITEQSPNYTTHESSTEDRIITGDGTPEGAFMTLNESETLIAQIDSLAYNSTPGTNYDYGLQEAYKILEHAKNDPNSNKMQYVVFMSDGEPYVYNRVQVEYGNDDPDGVSEAWLRGDEDHSILASYLADTTTYPATQYFNTRGDNWYAEIIKTPEGQTLSDMPQVDYYSGYRTGLGATMFTIGYGAGEPGSLTCDVLTTMASTEDNYYYASGNLQEAYDSILKKIIFAANNAVVTDKMGENFQLQFAPSLTLDNGMATITFDPAPYIEIGSWKLNSDGTRNEYTVIEKITFQTDSNGKLTAAYSNLLGDKNIYDSSTNKIVGSKVTYDITNETFSWNIGDITRDEITLKYYAYLEGSAEGEREGGTFATNEYAYVDYVNYRGTQCHQVFPVPTIGWKDAVVNYEFYLVNEDGQPVNTDGIVVPFAERVLVGQEKTEKLLLNSAGDYSAITLVAKEKLPAGYLLFNEDTTYSVAVSSGDNPSQAIINDKADIKTTYFRDGSIVYCGDGVVPVVNDYMNTHVSFAVLRVGGIVPDSVVVDYGLPVKINVLVNDINANKGKLNAIGTKLVDGTELNNIPYVESRLQDASSSLTLTNGIATIEGDKIVFTPTNLTMSEENVFYYEYLTDEGVYLYTEVTVIPAANIYYEESFFTFKNGDGYVWQKTGSTLEEKFQAEDRPGSFSFAEIDANNVYGMDHAYDDSYTYSLGSAMFTSVDANAFGKEPTAEFTFCGTGFDLFSVTNSNTGAVLVSIYKQGETTLYKNYIVQTYYGYSYEEDEEGNGTFVPNPDSDGCLYQVPVISARELGYGTYRVVIKPMYSDMFDTSKDGSYDIYVDSVRIYNPAGQKPEVDSVIGDAYLEDNEYNPNFTELRKTILDSQTFYDDVYKLDNTQYSQGSIFIDSIGSLDANGISDKYRDAGPNNEVYLAKGQAIAFHLVSDEPIAPTSVELGMKTVFGNTSEVALMNTNDLTPRYVTVSGAHEMFRRLASVIVWDENELATTGKYKTKYPIVIVNTSDSILSLTDLKWAFTSADAEGDLQVVVNSATPAMAYATAKSVMAFPYTEEDIKMEWSDTSLKEGAEVTLTITTPADIALITIDGIEITEFTVDENGNKVWTYTFNVVEIGEKTYDIILFANNGRVSQPMVTETITVSEDNGVANPFNTILEFIKSILEFFRGIFA